MLYFGCEPGDVGHYLWTEDWSRTPFPSELSDIDGGYCPPAVVQPQGVARCCKVGGMTVLAFWDRSGDNRPGSNSAFIDDGDVSPEDMIRRSKNAFPLVWARMQFDVKVESTRGRQISR